MNIGIIGIGNIGGTLARKLIAAGHNVFVTNSKGAEGARLFAEKIGAEAVDIRNAVEQVDIVILSIPFFAIANLPKGLFDNVSPDTIVVDTGNYYPGLRDPQIQEIDAGLTESVWVSKQIGHPIIKAFNNIPVHSLAELARPKEALDRIAIAVAGDNIDQKNIVMNLIDNDIGFDPVDSGSLNDSWRQEPCTRAYCCDWNASTMKKMLADQNKHEAREKLKLFPEQLITLGVNPEHAQVISLNRSLYGYE